MPERTQSLREEVINSLTHGLGVLFSIVAISLLITFSVLNGTAIHIVSSAIFGGSFLLLYTFSTLYHAIQHPETKSILRIFDHISIYILIAGSYTPFLLLAIGGFWGWVGFGVIWAFALGGLLYKVFLRYRFPRLSLIIYLGLGWMAVLFIKPLIENVDAIILWLLLGGGLSYTLGTIFYANTRMRYSHGIWHVFVLGGTIFHFIAVMYLLQ